MHSSDIHFSGTSEDVRRLIIQFVASMSGRAGEFEPYVRGIKLRVGMVALACVQEAFIVKAGGGMGDDGIAWAPLKKQTIANRPMGAGDRQSMKGYGGHNGKDKLGRIKRGFLSPAEDAQWRRIFATRKAQFIARYGMDDAAASARAGQIAWATLKSQGAKTKLEVLGNRKVQIGRDTGRLLNSLSPAIANPESQSIMVEARDVEDQILREEDGAVVIGSNVAYAGPFHKMRPLWPDGELPPAWGIRVAEAAASGIAEAIEMIIGQGNVAA